VLSKAANYGFFGKAAQVTGALLPDTINNLTISNAAGVTLSKTSVIKGVLTLKAGVFDNTNPFMLSSTGSILTQGGSLLFPASLKYVTIAEARKDLNNDYIADHKTDTLAVFGVITTPNMGASASQTSYFIQDATGGIDVFSYGVSATTYAIGDSVMVVGKVDQYKGLVELVLLALDDAHFKILKHNAVVPAPKKLSLHQFLTNAESYEGQLIELDSLSKATGTWPATAANVSIYLMNASKSDTVQMFLDLDAGIAGTEPAYPINVVGFVSQYSSSTPPNNGYEICPRSGSDIIHTPGTVGVGRDLSGIPTIYELRNNYPNPFNPSTTIEYALPLRSTVTIKIYSILGKEITTLVNNEQAAGYYQSVWNAANIASGMYFLRITAQPLEGGKPAFTQVKKMVLMK
jgi:DNA/RNA endonuclease YhcR with UshA esterase domain